MYYIIYKITNQIDGKFYIGSHKTENLDDNYMGSGKYLKYAQEKYGIENFTKEILFVFDTPDEMYKKEAEIVNEEFLATNNTYNLKIGGFGGWDYINSNPEKYLTEKRLSSLISASERNFRWKQKFENDQNFRDKIFDNLSKAFQKSRENNPEGTFKGKKHSPETRKIMSEKSKERMKDPKNNTQYGTMWITNGLENKKIKKEDSIPNGWKKGRVFSK